ncbi:hypothetical protein ACO0QE_001857 [Hanseniaspora vineae]
MDKKNGGNTGTTPSGSSAIISNSISGNDNGSGATNVQVFNDNAQSRVNYTNNTKSKKKGNKRNANNRRASNDNKDNSGNAKSGESLNPAKHFHRNNNKPNRRRNSSNFSTAPDDNFSSNSAFSSYRNNRNNSKSGVLVDPYDFEQDLQDQIMASQFRSGTKKAQISINHLLDLQFDSESSGSQNAHFASSAGTRNYSKHHRDNDMNAAHLHGASFVNATYKFVVSNKYDYSEQYANPNVLIKPEQIIRVVILKDEQQESQNCPICLSSDIVAPRMVACGHVFCYTCLLQFFDANNADTLSVASTSTASLPSGISQMHKPMKRRYHECPLCASMIKENSTNILPVLFETRKSAVHDVSITSSTGNSNCTDKVNVNKKMDFQLICRPHGNILGLPVNLGLDPSLCEYPPKMSSMIDTDNYQFSRIIQTDVLDQIQFYKKDLQSIQEQYQLDQLLYNDDGKYAKLAEQKINETMEHILSEQLNDLDLKSSSKTSSNNQLKKMSQKSTEHAFIGTDAILQKYNDSNAFFYLEHVDDLGKRYFLSTLDVRLLKKTFGEYSKFPLSLHAKCENFTIDQRVNEYSIQNFKYFGHLPMGDTFNLCDIDWNYTNNHYNGSQARNDLKKSAEIGDESGIAEPTKDSLIPPTIMENFKTQLKSRRSKTTRKKQKEDHEKKVYEKQLEIEHHKFYEQEGAGSTSSWTLDTNNIPTSMNTFSSAVDHFPDLPRNNVGVCNSDTSDTEYADASNKKREYTQTVWGTSIPKNEQNPDSESDHDSWLPQDILDQIDTLNTNKKNGRGKKGKKKITLFVNSQRGTL